MSEADVRALFLTTSLTYDETEVPEGYDIHHCDGNPLNNDIENLVMVK